MVLVALISFAILYFGYRFYSSYLARLYSVTDSERVPSVELLDGIDYVPTNKFVLLGHHFSSIAGAGPILGPIVAGITFGWLPAILWVIAGSIFVGGLHDYSSLIISIRHKGKSIGEVANLYMGKRTYKVFLVFIWLALMYVVAVFADITATTFQSETVVAEMSIFYIVVAFAFGCLLGKYKNRLSLLTTGALVVLLLFSILSFKHPFMALDKRIWMWLLFIYAFVASIMPVNLLLQPRDYLSSYLLYLSVALGLIGLFFGNYSVSYPAFISFSSPTLGNLYPFLFITVACGAVSGFHSLVASGTTSKQIDAVKNARFIGYGAMLLEGVVAIIALGIVMMFDSNDAVLKGDPASVFASGLGRFSALLGFDPQTGKTFGFLAVSAFVLTTLDTATRIARYIFQELVNKTRTGLAFNMFATAISLVIPIVLINLKISDAAGNPLPCWKLIWPIFGITNQLLAALVLLIIYLWSEKEKIKARGVILLPAIFMIVTTVTALVQSVSKYVSSGNFNLLFYIAALLLILSVVVILESALALKRKVAPHTEPS